MFREISFQNLLFLSASVPKHKSKEEKEKDKKAGSLQEFLMG